MDVYIYYTVAAIDARRVRQRVMAVQERLADAYQITTQLKLRVDDVGVSQTWMEIYENVPAGFQRVIEHAAEEAGIRDLLQGPRHVEVFRDFELCV